MTKPGPKPKATVLKELANNPGKRPLNQNEAKPAAAAKNIPPPAYLPAAAKTEWKVIVPLLINAGLLSVLDLGPIATLCSLTARRKRAEKELDKPSTPLVIDGKKNPLHGVIMDIVQKERMIWEGFGMSPSARSNIDLIVAAAGGAAPTEGEPAKEGGAPTALENATKPWRPEVFEGGKAKAKPAAKTAGKRKKAGGGKKNG